MGELTQIWNSLRSVTQTCFLTCRLCHSDCPCLYLLIIMIFGLRNSSTYLQCKNLLSHAIAIAIASRFCTPKKF